jgi:hypothetical protein
MRTYYYALDSRPVCPRCKTTYSARIERGAGPAAMGRAVLYGGGAALAGAALLGAVVLVVGFGRIFCAIAIGFLVGRAVNAATGSYFDVRYRVLAAALTYFAIGLGSLAPVIRAAASASAAPPAATASAVETSAEEEDAGEEGSEEDAEAAGAGRRSVEPPSRDAAAAERLASGGFLRRVGGIVVLVLTLPLLAGLAYGIYGAAIGLFAIGYGVFKAWEITGNSVAYTVTGPHRVGSGPIPHTA